MVPEEAKNPKSDREDKDSSDIVAPSISSPDDEDELESLVPEEIADVLKELPQEERKQATRQVTKMMLMSQSGIVPRSSLTEKIEPQHIDKIISSYDRESERDLEKTKGAETTKRLGMGGILTLVLMVLLYAGFTGDKELSEKVILAGISGLGGYGAGLATSKKSID